MPTLGQKGAFNGQGKSWWLCQLLIYEKVNN